MRDKPHGLGDAGAFGMVKLVGVDLGGTASIAFSTAMNSSALLVLNSWLLGIAPFRN